MSYKFQVFLLLNLLFLACGKREVLPENGVIEVNAAFQPYIDQFVEEASTRGVTIDFSDTGLSMQFSSLPLGTAAQCQEIGDARRGSHSVLFDENLWAISAPERKEFLVFHELGHCELDRSHQNDQFPNGEWQSMMQGTISNAPLSDKNKGRPVVFYGFRKAYYLDELFGSATRPPSWSNFQSDYSDLSPNQKIMRYDTLNATLLQEKLELLTNNYELEIILKREKDIGDIGLKYGNLKQSYLFKVTDKQEVIIELIGQTSNEIDFYNGGTILSIQPYRLYFCNDLPINNENLQLTIRQQEGMASFFLNQEYLFQVDALNVPEILVGAIQQNRNLLIKRFIVATF